MRCYPQGYLPLLSLELNWALRFVNLVGLYNVTAFGLKMNFELQEAIIRDFLLLIQRYVWGTQEVVSV